MQPGDHTNAFGVDVSEFQHHPAWDQVRQAGKTFAVIRATYGAAHEDLSLAYNWPGVAAVGLRRSAYHFAVLGETSPDPVADAQTQAAAFLAALDRYGGIVGSDLNPYLDLESGGNPHGWAPLQILTWALHWLEDVDAAVKDPALTAGLYGDPAFLQTLAAGPPALVTALGRHPLWIARWNPYGAPANLLDWTTWTCWQYANAGQVPGIATPVDLDEWHTGLNLATPTPNPLTAQVQALTQQVAQLTAQNQALAARIAAAEKVLAG